MSVRSARGRRIVVGATVIAVAGVIVGTVVAGRMVWLDDATELNEAIADASPLKIAEIAAADGKQARGVFVQVTTTGHVCLSDAPLDAPLMGGGGCNPADDPLGGDPVSATLSYDGGPAIESVKDARVIGLVSANVARISVLMSDRSLRAIKLNKAKIGSDEFQAFGYRFKKADLKRGLGPTAIVAYDAAGNEVGRQPTGIGG